MNNGSMAKLIYELRKSKNMTQRQLAENLNITDKAVSKWERGLGYPDLSILSSLAETLGVTTNELLNGKRSVTPPFEENAIVETTLQYVNKVTFKKKKSVKFIAEPIITVTCLLGIFISVICDIAISGTFTWSLYPIAAISFAWLIIIPLFQFDEYRVRMSLISLSIFIFPFLSVLNNIIGGTKFMLPMGIPIALIAIGYLWGIYILFSIKNTFKWNMVSISILLGIPVSLLINYIVAKFINQPITDLWDVLAFGILGMASIVLFFIGQKQKYGVHE
ncbi:helix-turn-helix domain-containing protein [Cytobacillus sp. IB215665]|uniref:helix-turn-helix domain-containing protein n=1 Tax=Cytobacillus sp. IB215665 TaxID=3097357 RepID=UPI002A1150FB|nr:helix-turn-helix domain-containing protein [Cytobacillus sp. IB215665]MDX8367974.1 helix-turn-helix domain-containing protein [Cytobacillus sp. IB215665]